MTSQSRDDAVQVRDLFERLGDEGCFADAFSELMKFGPQHAALVPGLIAELERRDSSHRHVAAMALGQIGDAANQAVPALLGLLDSEHEGPRIHASLALGRIEQCDSACVARLRSLLCDTSLVVRAAAATSLLMLDHHTSDALEVMRELRSSSNVAARSWAAEGLAEASQKRRTLLVAVVELLDDHNDEIRELAARTLSRSDPDAVIALLRSAVDAAETRSMSGVLLALRELAEQAPDRAEPIVDLLRTTDALRAADPDSRRLGAQVAGAARISTSDIVAGLGALLADEDDWVREQGACALLELDIDAHLRTQAQQVLDLLVDDGETWVAAHRRRDVLE